MTKPYQGNIPQNVKKAAKYSVVSDGEGGWQIKLRYEINDREYALLTTSSHDRLTERVNSVKEEVVGAPGGAFYINEYGHVLVPDGETCYFAGRYDGLLEFDFEGKTIGPIPPQGIEPGDDWPGGHAGVSYTLTVDGDIRYEVEQGQRVRKVCLSDFASPPKVAGLVNRLRENKGESGRIYVNEAFCFFAPTLIEDGITAYIYLGRKLEEDPWFPEPE